MTHSIFLVAAVVLLGVFVLRTLIRVALPALVHFRQPATLRDRVLARYRGKDFGAWVFAYFKTRLDAMFLELPELLQPLPPVRTFLDVGCGFGIAGCFLLELFEGSKAFAVDPSAARVKAAAAAMGDRGHVFEGAAPDFEKVDFPKTFDAVFALDILPYLSDAELDLTLQRIGARLNNGDYLIVRSPVFPAGAASIKLKVSQIYSRFTRTRWLLRPVDQIKERIARAGFVVTRSQSSGNNPELFWFIATASVVEAHPQGDRQQQRDGVGDDQARAMNAKEFVQLLQPTDPA